MEKSRIKKKLSKEYKEHIRRYFPTAVNGEILYEGVNEILQNQEFTQDNTLFGTSFCPDEINEFVINFKKTWGYNFSLAGLGGIPFVGTTGFRAFSQHRPDNGNLFILYASHIGIDENGTLGSVLRMNQKKLTPACGSAIVSYNQLMNTEFRKIASQRNEEWDEQQKYMGTLVKRSLTLISGSPKPLLKLSEVVYDEISKKILNIIPKDFESNIALLGGIQINTSRDFYDYFLFKEFKIINQKNKTEINLLDDLQELLHHNQQAKI